MNNNPDRHKYFSKNGAEMLQTVAIRTPKYLCIKDNSLIIREKGSSVVLGKIALSDIWVIIIDNPQVTMTSALISGINDAGIGVLYCGSDHMPNGLALPLGAHPSPILQIYQYPRSRHIPSPGSISSHGQGPFLQCEVVESYKRYSKKGLMQWFRK